MTALTELEKRTLLAMGIDDGSRTEFNVFRVSYEGEIKKSDLLVAELVDKGVHPLIPIGTEDEYFKRLLISNGTRFTKYNGPLNDVRYSLDNDVRVIKTSVSTDLDTVALVGSFTTAGMREIRWFDQGAGPIALTPDPNVKIIATMDDNDYVKLAPTGAPGWSTNEWVPEGGRSIVGWPYGWNSFPDLNSETDTATKLLKRLKCKRSEFLTDLPVLVFDCVNGGCLPFLPGTRRFYVFNGVPGSSVDQAIGGYLLGEGDDIWYGRAMFHPDAGAVRPWGDSWGTFPKRNSYTGPSYAKSLKLTSSKMYPMSGSPQFINTINGDVDIASTTEELVGNVNVSVTDIAFQVNAVTGAISTENYREYLSSGYGLYPPLKEEDVVATMTTWVKTNGGINYKLKTEKCNGRSLKETTYYKDYGRARAKACKDNNYMDLRFNSEYTNKQVENKLGALVNRALWIQSETGLVTTKTVATTKTVTVTLVNANQFSAKASDSSTSTTHTLNEDGVSLFIDVYGSYRIIDEASVLSNLLGVDSSAGNLTDYTNEVFKDVDQADYDLRFGDYGYGYAISYEDVKLFSNTNQQIGFLAAQVTDFSQFEGTVMRILNSFDFNKVYTKLLPRLEAAAE